jgi:hypothetical protein
VFRLPDTRNLTPIICDINLSACLLPFRATFSDRSLGKSLGPYGVLFDNILQDNVILIIKFATVELFEKGRDLHSFRQINTKKLEFEDTGIKINAGIHFVAFAHIVGWVKRDIGTIYVGFAYLNAPQKLKTPTKIANPTKLVANQRLNPTYDLPFSATMGNYKIIHFIRVYPCPFLEEIKVVLAFR